MEKLLKGETFAGQRQMEADVTAALNGRPARKIVARPKTKTAATKAPAVEIKRLRLDQIEIGEVKARLHTSNEVVTEYAEGYQDGTEYPAIDVFHDGQVYRLGDGLHRFLAQKKNDFVDAECRVHSGDANAALWHACGANRTHGLRMTNADKRHACEVLLKTFTGKANREIARQVGCSDQLVADVRSELEGNCEITQLDKTVGADGKARPAKRESKAQTEDPPAAEVTSKSFAESYHADHADKPAAADLVSFLPANGQVASAFVEASASPDGNTHWFLLQEDSRNPGFFFAVHVDFGEDDTDGRIDFNMRAFRADAFADDRLSPIARWAAGIPGVKLSWDATDESPDWLWAGFIEPFLPDRMAHVKRTKTTEA